MIQGLVEPGNVDITSQNLSLLDHWFTGTGPIPQPPGEKATREVCAVKEPIWEPLARIIGVLAYFGV